MQMQQNNIYSSKTKHQTLQQLLQTKITKFHKSKKKIENDISPWSFYKEQIDIKNSYIYQSNPKNQNKKNIKVVHTPTKLQDESIVYQNNENKQKIANLKSEILTLMNQKALVKVISKYMQMSEKFNKKNYQSEIDKESNPHHLPLIHIYKQEYKQKQQSKNKVTIVSAIPNKSQKTFDRAFCDDQLQIPKQFKYEQKYLKLKKYSNLRKQSPSFNGYNLKKDDSIQNYINISKKIQNDQKVSKVIKQTNHN